jgi:acetyltransferase-like isoleucine patch superfamily enzyme
MEPAKFKKIGEGCTFAENVFIKQPECVTLGDKVHFLYGVYVQPCGEDIIIGSNTHFAPYGVLYGPLEVGANCGIAAHVVFAGIGHGYHDTELPFVSQQAIKKKIIVEDNVWIGANAVIIQGVRIGTGSIIGAGAVVTHDVAPYSVMGGVPARLIRKRK